MARFREDPASRLGSMGAISDLTDLTRSNFLQAENADYQDGDFDRYGFSASGNKFDQDTQGIQQNPAYLKRPRQLVRSENSKFMSNSPSLKNADALLPYDTALDSGIAVIDRGADNRGLLNQAEIRMLPRYYSNFPSQKPGQVYSPHLDWNDVSDFYGAKLNAFKNGVSDTFENIPKIPSAIGAIFSDLRSVFVDGGKRMQDEQRRAFIDARNGDFRAAGEVEGKQLGSALADSAIGWGVGKTLGFGVQSVNAMRRANILAAEEAKAINAARIANNFDKDAVFSPQFDSRTQQLQYKWQDIKPESRPALIDTLADVGAGRWVQSYEDALNAKYPGLNAHFSEKHGPDIPLRPNLEQRSIDGTHPRTGVQPSNLRAEKSSQFSDWISMRDALNEATTREMRGLPKYNGADPRQKVVFGKFRDTVGRGFMPDPLIPRSTIFSPRLENWRVNFDRNFEVPFAAFPIE